jgi:soluble lytic murein transglycosylase-like protein
MLRFFSNSWLRLIGLLVLAVTALPCFAGEVAVLKNGFSIRHERREIVGDVTRLYVNADGSSFVDVKTAEVDHFEAAPEAAAAPGSRVAAPSSEPTTASSRPATASAAATFRQANSSAGLAAPNFSVSPKRDLTEVVKDASGRYQLDPDLVNSVIKAESGFNARAVSPKGARGLMQLMPGTASQLGVPNAFDPQANVDGGTKYLRELLEKYNFDLVKALAAYNAGPQRVEQYKGVPPYYETRAYVARIVRDFNKKKVAQQKAAAAAKASAAKKSTSAKAPTSSPSTKSNSKSVAQAKANPQG